MEVTDCDLQTVGPNGPSSAAVCLHGARRCDALQCAPEQTGRAGEHRGGSSLRSPPKAPRVSRSLGRETRRNGEEVRRPIQSRLRRDPAAHVSAGAEETASHRVSPPQRRVNTTGVLPRGGPTRLHGRSRAKTIEIDTIVAERLTLDPGELPNRACPTMAAPRLSAKGESTAPRLRRQSVAGTRAHPARGRHRRPPEVLSPRWADVDRRASRCTG